MNFTSIEQSKKLLELGLSPESADMHYPDYYFDGNAKYPCNTPYKEAVEDLFHVYINPKTKRLLPCWSVGALFEVIPSVIKSHNKKYYLTYFRLKENRHYIYYLSSDPYRGIEERLELTYPDECNTFNIFGETMIKATYEMVVWLLENGYIKTK